MENFLVAAWFRTISNANQKPAEMEYAGPSGVLRLLVSVITIGMVFGLIDVSAKLGRHASIIAQIHD